jgi:hypothetical protein
MLKRIKTLWKLSSLISTITEYPNGRVVITLDVNTEILANNFIVY